MYKKKRKKYLRSSHVDGKREIACFHVETATGNRDKWRENRGHVVIVLSSGNLQFGRFSL